MVYLYIVLFIILAYAASIFLSRLIIPFRGFKKPLLPKEIPAEMEKIIKELEQKSPDARTYLENVYNFVQSRWRAERLKTILKFPLIFRTDIGEIWNSPGYAHCTTINFIFYTLLVKSKFFKEEDIKFKEIFFNMVPHQYLKIKVGGEWIDADPSVTYLKLPLGKRARFFG